jgi:hypothetical protein
VGSWGMIVWEADHVEESRCWIDAVTLQEDEVSARILGMLLLLGEIWNGASEPAWYENWEDVVGWFLDGIEMAMISFGVFLNLKWTC